MGKESRSISREAKQLLKEMETARSRLAFWAGRFFGRIGKGGIAKVTQDDIWVFDWFCEDDRTFNERRSFLSQEDQEYLSTALDQDQVAPPMVEEATVLIEKARARFAKMKSRK